MHESGDRDKPRRHTDELLQHGAKRDAMKPIAAHPILFMEFVRQGVKAGGRRQCVVKGIIEDAHHRSVRQPPPTGFDAGEIGRVMQRGKIGTGLQSLNDLIRDQH